jgi:hypothetical protein
MDQLVQLESYLYDPPPYLFMISYLLKPVKDDDIEGGTLYNLIPIENPEMEEDLSHIQTTYSRRASDETKVRVWIEGKERIPLKVLLRKSDDFGRFSLGKGDKDVINKGLLVIVLEPIDPDDRIFMEPIK